MDLEQLARDFAQKKEKIESLENEEKKLRSENAKTGEQLYDAFFNEETQTMTESIKISGVHFKDGRDRTITPKIEPKPTIKAQDAFVKWCTQNGHLGVVHVDLEINLLSQASLQKLRELIAQIKSEKAEEPGFNYEVHPATLASLVKKREEEDLPLPPPEVLSVYEIKTASVRRSPQCSSTKEVVVHE